MSGGGEAERERDARETNAQLGKRCGNYRTSATAENKPESTENFRY
jgi:hypothetical protein